MRDTALEVRVAQPADWPTVSRLLREAGLPEAGAREHLGGFILAAQGDDIVGVAGLEVHADEGLLRSVVVAPAARGTGLGQRLVAAMIAAARARGLRGLTLLTETAPDYFPRFGFRPITREAAPIALRASAEFREACPASAAVLRLDLQPNP